MSKIISVNAGSSSLKFQLFNMPEETVLTSGIVDRIGFEDAAFTILVNGEKIKTVQPILEHTTAVNLLLKALVEHKIVDDLNEIEAAGHRVVQGGEVFSESVAVDENVEKLVSDFTELAPLHNPANLIGYRAFKENLPNAKHAFIFDTAFHQTMGRESYIYPIPYEYYEQYHIRRYGAHGTSHQYVAQRCAELLDKKLEDTKIITCHLGNGASITAVKGGKSINTSMGFTPLSGLMMGTRSGDIDPSILTYLQDKLEISASEMNTILNKKSGMLGISGISSDARDIDNAVAEGNDRAKLTLEIYLNRLINVVGGYYLQLGGLDAIVFTGGIGENDTLLRENFAKATESTLNLDMDYELNAKTRGKETLLSKANASVKAFLIPTNEELVIARDTARIFDL